MAVLELSSRLFRDIIKHPALGPPSASLVLLNLLLFPAKGKDIGSNNRAMPGPLPGPKHWLVALGPFSHLNPRVALQSSNREFVESIKKSFTRWKSNNSPETEID